MLMIAIDGLGGRSLVVGFEDPDRLSALVRVLWILRWPIAGYQPLHHPHSDRVWRSGCAATFVHLPTPDGAGVSVEDFAQLRSAEAQSFPGLFEFLRCHVNQIFTTAAVAPMTPAAARKGARRVFILI